MENLVTGGSLSMFGKGQSHQQRGAESGFSLLEMVVVLGVIFVVTATALINILPSLKLSRANAGMEMVLGEMRRAHERAIDERRIYRLTFTAPQTIQLDVGQVAIIGSTITNSAPIFVPAQPPLTLPASIQFLVVPGIPTNPTATPDGFGVGATAIDFDIANGGGGTQIYFQPDGRALDGANRLNDGVVYLAEPNNLFSSRAVSLYGTTGRSKSWSLTQGNGAVGWAQ
jgi:type II secretory pathway pseudopilin PulG